MLSQAQIIKIAIASPTDLKPERDAIPRLFNRWNSIHEEDGAHIVANMWETLAVPELGDHPQHILDRQVIFKADLLVALFWTKIGSPTPTAASGTIEEIREFVKLKGPGRVMIYFCVRQVGQSPDEIDGAAISALKEFKLEMRSHGLYKEFKETAELERDLAFDLDSKVKQLRKGELPIPGSEEYKEAKWWDGNAADQRLRTPFDLGSTIGQIASNFARRMDAFDAEDGATNNKFLNLARHTYLSVARSIEMLLHAQPYEVDYRIHPRLIDVVRELKQLADGVDRYLRRPFPEYWDKGRVLSNQLTELANENESKPSIWQVRN